MTILAFLSTSSNATKDGLVVSLVADTQEENVDINLTIENTNTFHMSGVDFEITLPDGLVTESELSGSYSMPVDDIQTHSISTQVEETTQKNDILAYLTDNTFFYLWAGFTALTASGLIFIILKKKEKHFNFFSILVAVIVVIFFAVTITQNYMATNSTLEVSTTVLIKGYSETITATINYSYVALRGCACC